MNYVVTQVAKPVKNKVPQMQSRAMQNVDAAMDVYVKNAIVSLASAKLYTPDAVCILNCNFKIAAGLKAEAESAGIQIHQVPYGKYKSNEDFPWAITQYKFDSMNHVLEIMEENDCMLLLDTDTVCVRKLDDIFVEAQNSLILYAVNHGFKHNRRQEILRNYQKMYGSQCNNLIHYGGEFFAGNKENLSKLLYFCEKVIAKARIAADLEPWDDEHVLSIAADYFWEEKIYPASPYIFRYWTNQFYLVSTNYHYDPVNIWHLPAEKSYGMIVLYEYFEKYHKLPNVKQMAKIMGLPGTKYKKWNPYRWKMRIHNKLKH